jgi:hypothetical protein
MSEMKLIMESWRRFEKKSYAGTLCLFENRRVRRVPFVEALNSIGNTEKELDLFLEKWEKSLNYELRRINEGWEEEARNQAAEHGEEAPKGAENSKWGDFKGDPVLYLSTQIFLFIQKAKDNIVKYASKILAGARKIKATAAKFEEKNPRIYKIGTTVAKVAIAAVALYALQSVMGDTSAFAGDMTQFGDVVADTDQLNSLADALAQEDSEGLQKVAKLFRAMADKEGDSELSPHFSMKMQRLLVSIAEKDIEQLRIIGKYGDTGQEIAEKAAQLFADVPEPPSASPVPTGPITAPGNVTGNFSLTDILDQVEMANQLNSKPDPEMLKLVNIAAKGHPKIDPEITKRAQELLSQIK